MSGSVGSEGGTTAADAVVGTAGVGVGIGTGAGAGTETGVGVGVGTGTAVGLAVGVDGLPSDDEAGFVTGFAGNEGCRGLAALGGKAVGRCPAGVAGVGGDNAEEAASAALDAMGGVGGAGGAAANAFDTAARARASFVRCTCFASCCFRSVMRALSFSMSLTKSFTSPGLHIG